MKARQIILKKIEELYYKNITDISSDIGTGRGVIYYWAAQDANFNNPITEKLKNKYPKAFKNITKEKQMKKGNAEKFKGINKDVISEPTNQQKLPIDGIDKSEPSPKKNTIVLKNLRCPNECYFMKVSAQDYNKIKPKCPLCDSYMLTKEDRAKED